MAAQSRSRILWPIGVGVLAVLVLVVLFLAGTRLPGILSAQPAPTPTPVKTPTPTPTLPPGPRQPGSYLWNELQGGECIDPYTSPWQTRFTVVDCALEHAAQVVSRGSLGAAPEAPYPSEADITAGLNVQCTAPAVLDYAALQQYSDITWQASYPATLEQWNQGLRNYYCFISRSSGQTLSGSFALSLLTQ